MKILLTGAKGFIGSNLNGIAIESDIMNQSALEQEIRGRSAGSPYVVIHCAAISDVDECEKNRNSAWKTNVIGTNNVAYSIDASLGKLILLSSAHVYDGNAFFPYTEKHTPNPVNWYGSTKFGAEAVLALYSFDSLAIRLGKIYSDGLITKILSENKEVPSFQVRNFMRVED